MHHRDDTSAHGTEGAQTAFFAPLGLVTLTGPDRIRLLQALVTNDLSGLTPGEGCRALLLDHKGRVVADLVVLVAAEAVWLLTEGDPEALSEVLDGYILADDVDLSASTIEAMALTGPGAPEVLVRAGLPVPEAPWSHRSNHPDRPEVVHRPLGDRATWLWLTGPEGAEATRTTLLAAGAEAVSPEAFERLRIEARDPRWGREITPEVLALEVGLDAVLHRTKGCYVGQETVVRGTVRGQSRWTLAALGGDGAPPAAGSELRAGGRPVGRLTSVAPTAEGGGWVALARIRREAAEAPRWEVDAPDGQAPARPLPA